MAKVELKSIGKIYEGNVRAVTNSNITIEDKELCVFVGPSGCGKSTTLRMIAGLEDISEGKLFIDGKEMNDVPPKDRDIAMVFQNYALYPHMSVYDNMAFGLKIRRMDKSEIDRRVKAAAKQLDLEQYLARKPKALSGGQRQRDAKLRVTMRAEIAALHNRLQATMIYVTHDQIEAMTLGDKIVVMKDGVIQQIGAPMYLYNNPINKFVAGFIGTPPMNFLKVKVLEKGGKIICEEGAFDVVPSAEHQKRLKEYVGKEVFFGIRPEDVEYSEKPSSGAMQMKISNKEPLGAETHLYLTSNKGQNLIAKTTANIQFRVGETVNLIPNMDKAKFFDVETEMNIVDDIKKEW